MTLEADSAPLIHLRASEMGVLLLRNNSGAFKNDTGRLVRFGLGNDSAATNKRIKSSDFIGVKPTLITQEMVGTMIGRFVCIETKKLGWTYKATLEEVAQYHFMKTIAKYGGLGQFATCPEDLVIL